MHRIRIALGALAGASALLGLAWDLSADPPARKEKGEKGEQRVTVEEAKGRAKLMHDIYSTTLDSMHHHFFRRDRATLPARALDDVFAEIDRKTKVKTRWIAVNTPAMSLNHEAESEFEKKAVTALSEGKAEFEATEGGYYARATPIPLGVGCVGCHTKFSPTTDKTPRIAGLVISIPVSDK
jgi:hypothetical protein